MVRWNPKLIRLFNSPSEPTLCPMWHPLVEEGEKSVCTKESHSLNRAEVNHAPGSYIYTEDFIQANSKMADSTAGQLKSVLRVNKASGKGFEPRVT